MIPTPRGLLTTSRSWNIRFWVGIIAFLSLITFCIHGYHPFSEDGGLYAAGVEYNLDQKLFPHYTAFVTEHLGYSLFAPALFVIVRGLHLHLDWALLLTYFVSLALTFCAAHQLLRRCIVCEAAQFTGMALFAVWWTLPVAGTSLMLMDPYVTARSLSTPLSLLAIAYALDDWRHARSASFCVLSIIAAALFHPLMAAYATGFVLTLRATRMQRTHTAFSLLSLAAMLLALMLHMLSPPESPSVVAAEISRYYWFLSQWHWFELLGLAGPLGVLALLLRYQSKKMEPPARCLISSSLFVGFIGVLVALLFCHQGHSTHLVARLQPLRIFLLFYAVMTLLLGAVLGDFVHGAGMRAASTRARQLLSAIPTLVLIALALVFFRVQRTIYPASPHIELPGREAHNTNPWVQAFLWTRARTPSDALFALDPKYVNENREDAQTFRAWSLRSALPDFSKDGGEAAISPSLAESWKVAADAQRNLSTEDDATRDARIMPLGATWMIVHAETLTSHDCPYANESVKVCRLAVSDLKAGAVVGK